MILAFKEQAQVRGEKVTMKTSSHFRAYYGNSNRRIQVRDEVTQKGGAQKGKIVALTKDSVWVQFQGVPETSVLPYFLAEATLEFAKENPKTFDIMITRANKEGWYGEKKGQIFTASVYDTMFWAEGDNTGGVMSSDAEVIDKSKPLTFGAALFFLNPEFGLSKAVSEKGDIIATRSDGVVCATNERGVLAEPLVTSESVMSQKWYLILDEV